MWLLSPLSWLLIALVAGVFVWRFRSRFSAAWRLCAAVVVISLLAMTPWLANLLLADLEHAEPGASACRGELPTVAVVLAGGIEQRPVDANDFGALGLASRRRLDSGLAYWREQFGRVLVFSGGPAHAGLPAESQLLAAYAHSVGVPDAAIRLEAGSTTTWDNARRVSAMVPALPRRIVLITSALHMRRAILAFESAGFVVCPIRADPRLAPNDFPSALLPGSSALRKTEAALHEYVGMAYYRLRVLASERSN